MHAIIGTHAIRQMLVSKVEGTLYLVKDTAAYKNLFPLVTNNVCVKYCATQEIKAMGGHHGALFVVKRGGTEKSTTAFHFQTWLQNTSEKEYLCVLVLDHIQDAQNLGAIFRSAAVFGIACVILPARRGAPENEFAMKASSGAMNFVCSCKVSNIHKAVTLLKKNNIWTYALTMSGASIANYSLPKRCAFVLGNEHNGITPLVAKTCDDALSIPMHFLTKQHSVDSLNVSVSAGIACYEYRRNYV